MRFAWGKEARRNKMDLRKGNWINPWITIINIAVMIATHQPCTAYYCDFGQCHWRLDKAKDSSARLTYEKADTSNNYRPHDHVYFALIQDFGPGEIVYFVSPWFNSSSSSCTMIYDSELLDGTINVVILTQFSSNNRHLEPKSKAEHPNEAGIVSVGRMTEAFQVGFQITADRNNSHTLAAFYQVHLVNCSKDDISAPFCPLHEISCNNDVCIPRDHRCDIKEDCYLPGDEQECEDLPHCAFCTFEKDFCCWRNSNKDKGMRWVRHNGPTPTPKTGPQGDHTNGTGYYIYTHRVGSSPACAVLESIVFPPPPEETRDFYSPYVNSCQVRFFYHFHGYHVVSVSLKLVNVCDASKKPITLWSTDEAPGGMDIWRKAVGTINVSYSYSIEINGLCGIGVACDIAIDDLSFSPECFGHGLLEILPDSHAIKSKYINNGTFYSNDTHMCFSENSEISIETKLSGFSNIASQNIFNVWLAVSVIISLSCIISGYIFWRRRQQALLARRMVRLKSFPSPVSLLPHNRLGDRISTEVNPTYDMGMVFPENTDIRQLPRSHVHLGRPIGQGAFGEVYQGHLSNIVRGYSEYPVAVKTLPALSTEQAGEDFVMEAIIMSKFNHPNIVKFVGVCFEAHPRFIVLELLNGGDLRNFLRENRPKPDMAATLTSKDLLELSLDVAKGCQYLEMNRFIHRDIAARNCLLTGNNGRRKAKIADFGMARDIYRSDYYRKDGRALLPVKWMPPEAFIDGIFSTKTDIWSFGVLLWEIFSLGCSPYPGQGNQDVIQHVAYGARMGKPRGCTQVIYDVMLACWQSNADDRPDFNHVTEVLRKCSQDEEILSHPLPDGYCPLIVEAPPEPLAPPYRGARKVRAPKFYTHGSRQKEQLHRTEHHNTGPDGKLSYASIGFSDYEDEEVRAIKEEEEEEEEEEDDDDDDDDDDRDRVNLPEGQKRERYAADTIEKNKTKALTHRKKKTYRIYREHKHKKDGEQNGGFVMVSDNEESDFEQPDHYCESDELLEEFQMSQQVNVTDKKHLETLRQMTGEERHYQNQRFNYTWKRRQRERGARCRPVLEGTEELDETELDDNHQSDCENGDNEKKVTDGYEQKIDGNGETRCLPESVTILPTCYSQCNLKLNSSPNLVIRVGQNQMDELNRFEYYSETEIKHATSLPSVHYQNCGSGKGEVKQQKRSAFLLT